MAGSQGSFWENRVVNPLLRRVLRTRAGRRWGRRLAVLRYRGSKTGRPHEVVVQYARTDAAVWIVVRRAEEKTWWHNLRTPREVDLWLAGEHVRARAVAVEGAAQAAESRRGLVAYLARLPQAGAVLGVPRDADAAALEAAAKRVVFVRADIRPEPDTAA